MSEAVDLVDAMLGEYHGEACSTERRQLGAIRDAVVKLTKERNEANGCLDVLTREFNELHGAQNEVVCSTCVGIMRDDPKRHFKGCYKRRE
jgi:hypothetical protein